MTIHSIIREKRKETGLTQEQIAQYLGVSTPAVNKWENGVSFPDITLLSPLARVLKTDLNSLLCFHEDLTEQEINLFGKEVYDCIMKQGFECGFCLVKEKIEEYPKSDKLIYSLVMLLEGAMAMSGMTVNEKKQYEEAINMFYVRVTESESKELRDSALFMLASKHIGNARYDKAQQLIDQLPEHNIMDKRNLQALLWTKEGKSDKALEVYERMLLMSVTNVWNAMLSLINIEIEEKKVEIVSKIARICSEYAKVLELPDYYELIPLLLEAAARQSVETTLQIIEKILSCCNVKWNFADSVLFKDILCKGEGPETIPILPGIIAELDSNPLFSFIQENDSFKKLMHND